MIIDADVKSLNCVECSDMQYRNIDVTLHVNIDD